MTGPAEDKGKPGAVDDVHAAIREIVGRRDLAILPDQELGKDLGIDSLEFVRLVQIIEEKSDVILSDEEAAKAITAGDLVALVIASARAKNE